MTNHSFDAYFPHLSHQTMRVMRTKRISLRLQQIQNKWIRKMVLIHAFKIQTTNLDVRSDCFQNANLTSQQACIPSFVINLQHNVINRGLNISCNLVMKIWVSIGWAKIVALPEIFHVIELLFVKLSKHLKISRNARMMTSLLLLGTSCASGMLL